MPWLGRGLFYTVLIFVGSTGSGLADNGWEGQIFSFTEENDADVGTDRHYTQGARISYLSADQALPPWLQKFSSHLPAVGMALQASKFGVVAGQEIYTPEDLRFPGVTTNDRPYAGWLFSGLTLQRRGEVSAAWRAMESVGVDVGVTGPASLADTAQQTTHHSPPQGWKHQLKNELGFDLRYERRYLFRLRDTTERWGADLIPGFRGSSGTVATFLGLGTTLRFGYRIPNEFEAQPQPAPPRYGVYLFTGAEERYVIRNIFLDGNTFASSLGIEKKPWVTDLRVGLTFVLKSVELTLAQTLRTREFSGQKENDSFGTAMVTVKF